MKRVFLLLAGIALLISPMQALQPAFAQADSLINAAVAEHTIPGAVLCVVQGDKIIYNQAYGCRRVHPTDEAMTNNTVFDLASVSKVVGTGMTAMSLVDKGQLDLDAKVSQYLPEFEGDATIRDLMTHVSGLPAYATWSVLLKDHPDATKAEKKKILKDYVCHCDRLNAPGEKFRYSCLNFITLQYVMEAITGKSLDKLAKKRVFRPLKMKHTCYNPGKKRLVAPTEIQADSVCLHGVVHDPLARIMNSGVSGNAGVFSTSEDLARMAIWMFREMDNGAKSKEQRTKTIKGPFSRETLEKMLTVPEGYEQFGRTLCWGVWEGFVEDVAESGLSPRSVYHTGYTGTFMVADPENKIAVILLAHRVHPYDKGGLYKLRCSVVEAIATELLGGDEPRN